MWKSLFWKLIYFVPRLLALPFVYIGYFFLPWLKIWDPWKAPMNKFMGETLSVFVFIALLIYSVIHGQSNKRVPNINAEDICIYVWVAGYCWVQVKLFWYGGINAYIKCWWYIYDFVMLLMFIVSFVARFTSWVRGQQGNNIDADLEKQYWPWNDPMLVSESFYCLACVFAIGRLVYLFQMSQILGPVQLSLSRMLYDVLQMFMLLFLAIFAFSMGMTRLYRDYKDGVRKEPGEEDKNQPDAFTRFVSSHYLSLKNNKYQLIL